MKYIKNEAAVFYCINSRLVQYFIARLADLVQKNPLVLEPVMDLSEDAKAILSQAGLQLYPTVRKTTLIYDTGTESYLKILHPLNLKNRVLFRLRDMGGEICRMAEQLIREGINVSDVIAYGHFKKSRLPFFVVKKAEGESLYDILIRGKRTIGMEIYLNVITEVAKLHCLGYWLGDAHLSHIFIKDEQVSGIIDIDSVRRNRPFSIKNCAKDIAGLNHPELPLTKDEKKAILDHYLKAAGIKNEKKFIRLLKHYTERRWKD
jgi:tRNA A-37 threonylcarbamoyl transferase component Bud32